MNTLVVLASLFVSLAMGTPANAQDVQTGEPTDNVRTREPIIPPPRGANGDDGIRRVPGRDSTIAPAVNAEELRRSREIKERELKELRMRTIKPVPADTVLPPTTGDTAAKREEFMKRQEEMKKNVEAQRETIKKEIETRRVEFQKKQEELKQDFKEEIKARQEEAHTKIEERKQEFQQKLVRIKDEEKKKAVTRIDEELSKLNARMTAHFTDVLGKLDDVLERIASRANKAAARDLDVGKVKTAIDAATQKIKDARDAVARQAGETYPLAITTDAALRADVGRARQALHDDLAKVRTTVVAARDAVHNAATTLAQIPRVNDDTAPSPTPLPTPTSTSSPLPTPATN